MIIYIIYDANIPFYKLTAMNEMSYRNIFEQTFDIVVSFSLKNDDN